MPSFSDLMSAFSLLMCSRRARLVASYADDCSRRTFSSCEHARAARGRGRGVLVGLLERVAQEHEIARAVEHLLLELVHFGGQVVDAAHFLDAALRLMMV